MGIKNSQHKFEIKVGFLVVQNKTLFRSNLMSVHMLAKGQQANTPFRNRQYQDNAPSLHHHTRLHPEFLRNSSPLSGVAGYKISHMSTIGRWQGHGN